MKLLNAFILALSLLCPLLPNTANAGLTEGLAAYQKKDYANALREFTPLAEQGNGIAQANLGEMYYEGYGVQENKKEAFKLFRLAANQGIAKAQYMVGHIYGIYIDLNHELPHDKSEAMRWWHLAANQGHAQAQYWLGWEYGVNIGNLQESVKWTRLSAAQGHQLAISALAFKYERGYGVRQSNAVAYALYGIEENPKGHGAQQKEALALKMGIEEIELGNFLITRLRRPGNFLNALDQFQVERQ